MIDKAKDHPKTDANKTGRVFFLFGKKVIAINVPKGIDKITGVRNAIPKRPYLFIAFLANFSLKDAGFSFFGKKRRYILIIQSLKKVKNNTPITPPKQLKINVCQKENSKVKAVGAARINLTELIKITARAFSNCISKYKLVQIS